MDKADKLNILQHYFGHTQFRKGQAELIDCTLSGRDLISIMPTGAGKSICYQIPALMLDGITIVVSPLISLMKDQVGALEQSGIKSAYLNSALSSTQFTKVLNNTSNGMYKILYVAPERLEMPDFIEFAINADITLVTVDEAHCISQWGQDFRPSYTNIHEFIRKLKKRPTVSAYTATATDKVRKDIVTLLHLNDPFVMITGFDRQNLYFGVEEPKDKYKALLNIISRNNGRNGIVYCSTRKAVEEVSAKLDSDGHSVTRYHAGLSNNERQSNQDDFIYDRKTIMVATNAFGMGIDKSNVSFVVHYNMPKNLESYYQEAGRAGRDGSPAECILLYGAKDVSTNQYLIKYQGKDQPDHIREMMIAKDNELLKAMTFYAKTTDCLRTYILKYFGERTSGFCANCSNCNTKFETVDITIAAQKILSCIYRVEKLGREFGKSTITNILHGNTNEKLMNMRLDTLSTYGIMADTPIRRIYSIIDYLIHNDYIESTDGKYPVLRLVKRSSEILKDRKLLEMKLPKEVKEARQPKQKKADGGDLFEILRKLRYQLAANAHIPAYHIFSDATLLDMCSKLPQSSDELLNISGIGQVKLKQYGDIFMETIAEYIRKTP